MPASTRSSPTSTPAARSRRPTGCPTSTGRACCGSSRCTRTRELMGVLPERDWIMRAPTLRRKLALTAKVQDEVGHAQLLYRVAEDLGKPREAMIEDLLAGKTKFHNVFHYPTRTWADIGDDRLARGRGRDRRPAGAARLVATGHTPDDAEDLLGGVGPHHARPRRRRDDDERHADAARDGPGGARPLVGAADADARPADDRARRTATCTGGSRRRRASSCARSSSSIYVPRIRELGLTLPDPELRLDEATGEWRYTEPDWAELRAVVTGHGPEVRRAASSSGGSTATSRPGCGPRSWTARPAAA